MKSSLSLVAVTSPLARHVIVPQIPGDTMCKAVGDWFSVVVVSLANWWIVSVDVFTIPVVVVVVVAIPVVVVVVVI